MVLTRQSARHAQNAQIPLFQLPVEMIDGVASLLDQSSLLQLALASKALHPCANRCLYRSITVTDIETLSQCARTLSKRSSLPLLVRSFNIHVRTKGYDTFTPSDSTLRLLQRTLHNTTLLTTLHLFIGRVQCPWILKDPTFQLEYFATEFVYDVVLVQFLESQPSIKKFILHEYKDDVLNVAGGNLPKELSISALPTLSELTAVHTSPEALANLANGRSLTTATIPWYTVRSYDFLDALRECQSLSTLNLFSFEPDAPMHIMTAVSSRFPNLQSFQLMSYLTHFTRDLLMDMAVTLSAFKSLSVVWIVAVLDEVMDEEGIAARWHEECPTLQSITLPSGHVWSLIDGTWSSNGEDSDVALRPTIQQVESALRKAMSS